MKSYNRFFLISASVIIFDQLTKFIISNLLSLNQSITLITNFLSITLIHNTGAAFGMLKNMQPFLTFISLIVIGFIIYYLDRIPKKECIPFALILGGAVGNLIDRIFLSYVIDFINFSFWPAFNIADSCLTVGVIWLVYVGLKK